MQKVSKYSNWRSYFTANDRKQKLLTGKKLLQKTEKLEQEKVRQGRTKKNLDQGWLQSQADVKLITQLALELNSRKD